MDEQEKVTSAWEEEPILPDETPEAEASGTDTPPKAEAPAAPDNGTTSAPEPSGEQAPEVEPDYKALYEGEKERQNAEKYRAVYNEQLSLTGNEAIARMVARNECGGRDYPLENAPQTPPTDFRAALTELQSVYPDATEMPQSVMREFMNGKSLKDAYAAHRAKQDADTIESLRREVAALKKAADNRAAAPVKGSNGAAPENFDPFLKGFDSEW